MITSKKLTFFVLVLILAGCSKQNDFFAKKQECAKYIPQVEKEVNELESRTGNSATQPEVFYSPKLDTCLSSWTLEKDDSFLHFEITDLFTKEQIYSKGYLGNEIKVLNKQGLTGFEEYNAKKEELKKVD